MPPATFQFPILAPQDCEGCGLCCEGIGSPVAIYTYRLSHAGGYLYRPPNLPPELGEEIDAYFGGLKGGEEPLGHCLWFDPETRRCKHHTWRPNVCRQYEVGCDACLDERRPYLTGDQSETSAGLAAAERIDAEGGLASRRPTPSWRRPPAPGLRPAGGCGRGLPLLAVRDSPQLACRVAHDDRVRPMVWTVVWRGSLTAIWCVLGPGPWF